MMTVTVGGAEWVLHPGRVTIAADEYRCQRTLYAEAQCCRTARHKGACLVEFLDRLADHAAGSAHHQLALADLSGFKEGPRRGRS